MQTDCAVRAAVIGTGYVGLVTGACLAYLGHRVTCVDADEAKIAGLRRGEVPIYEPWLQELLDLARVRGGLEFTTELSQSVAESDVIFIAVGTPPLATGEADLQYLKDAARRIGASMQPSHSYVVVNKSTAPVGCGNLVDALVREGVRESHGITLKQARFAVASNPEFLREGSAVADSLYPDRVVLGALKKDTIAVLLNVYAPLLDQHFPAPYFLPRPKGFTRVPLVATTLINAEMIKYASNAFLAMKIGFANEIANLCERVDADATEVMAGVGLDARIGPSFLSAGLGWGGSCFGKDIQALLHTAGEYGYESHLLHATLEVNRAQWQLVIQKLQEKLFILKGRTVGLLGLAFKPGTDDLRDAPSLHIAERLLDMGASVKAYDPIAMPRCRDQHPELKIHYCESPLELAADADALVLVTEWDEFRGLNLTDMARSMALRVLVDGRNFFEPEAARRAGFDYMGFGRSALQANGTIGTKAMLHQMQHDRRGRRPGLPEKNHSVSR